MIQSIKWPSISQPKERSFFLLSLGFCLMVMIGIGRDFIDAYINDYSFYFSESFVFKVYWFLFIPLFGFLFFLTAKFDKRKIELSWSVCLTGVLSASMLHLIMTTGLLFGVFFLVWGHAFSPTYLFGYFVKNNLFETLFIYGFLFFFLGRRLTKSLDKPGSDESFPEFIMLTAGKKRIPVSVTDIQFIMSDRPYIAIYTSDDKYLNSSSLKKFSQSLDPEQFIRVHRSSIVNIEHVSCLRSRSNGDYDIIMKTGNTVRASRNYSQNFKRLLNLSTG